MSNNPNPTKSPAGDTSAKKEASPCSLIDQSNNQSTNGVPTGEYEKLTPAIAQAIVSSALRNAERFPAVRLAFTGRLKVGKDHVASAVGAEIHGFAEPLYRLCEYFFGTSNKDEPGMRSTLQAVGQWGRAVVDEQYPLSPARGIFTTMARDMGERICPNMGVNWPAYGQDPDIWLNACMCRMGASKAPVQAIVNARFPNEFSRIKHEGFHHFHVMCSPQTYLERLKKAGLLPTAPVLNDLSEKLAKELDANVMSAYSRQPEGPKLMAVWSDPFIAPPSPRLFTVEQFKDWVWSKQPRHA